MPDFSSEYFFASATASFIEEFSGIDIPETTEGPIPESVEEPEIDLMETLDALVNEMEEAKAEVPEAVVKEEKKIIFDWSE